MVDEKVDACTHIAQRKYIYLTVVLLAIASYTCYKSFLFRLKAKGCNFQRGKVKAFAEVGKSKVLSN